MPFGRRWAKAPRGTDHRRPLKQPRTGDRRRRAVPEYLERFGDLVLEAASGGPAGGDAQELLAKLLDGQAEGGDFPGPSQMSCHDALGFVARIGSAGSGAASLFPIAAGICGVEPGGALVVEEPEAHLDPLRQQRMIAEVVKAAAAKNARLLFTTHSEYVVYPLLSMVSHGGLRHDDLGLYYFRRDPGSYARIEKIGVSRDGEVDRELFGDALDALGTSL